MTPTAFFHGGASGLRRGSVILPGMGEHRYVEGCPCCEAQALGESHQGIDPPTPPGWVYGTTSRIYGRWYASRVWRGDLYKVRLIGDIERSTEDRFPTWRARSAEVVKVLERRIVLTMKQRKHIFLRWGGTELEFRAMVAETRRQFTAPSSQNSTSERPSSQRTAPTSTASDSTIR